MPSDIARCESIVANDFLIHANVFHIFECTRKCHLSTHEAHIHLTIIRILLSFQLNIHRFKVLARFGLMHIFASNICVWIRTLFLESIKDITIYHQNKAPSPDDGAILDNIRQHTLRHAGTVLGTHLGPDNDWEPINLNIRDNTGANEPQQSGNLLQRIVQSTARNAADAYNALSNNYPLPTSSPKTPLETTTMMRKLKKFISSTTSTTSTTTTTTTTTQLPTSTLLETTTTSTTTPSTTTLSDLTNSPTTVEAIFASFTSSSTPSTTTTTQESYFNNNIFAGVENAFQTLSGLSHNDTGPAEPIAPVVAGNTFEDLDALFPARLTGGILSTAASNLSCGRQNIMGTIVQDSAPYLYPFVIEYSLIGAVVIYVMWKHIGRYPKISEEDLEHRLEVMLSRRAVAMAQQAQIGRVDCVGASKGLFFGLLLLVGSLICLILFFVLVHNPQLSLLAIYLADASHCGIMGFAVLAILIGFCR